MAADMGGATGECYRDLFRADVQLRLAHLGTNPTIAALRREVNAQANPLSDGRFKLELGLDDEGVVGHVHRCDPTELGGVTAHQLIAACDKTLRLGALADCGAFVRTSGDLSVPADLPWNVPDGGLYPFARYTGLRVFVHLINPGACWDFLVTLGAERDVTPDDDFWGKAFATAAILEAYFKLPVNYRTHFLTHVHWVRDPMPGRPGGAQVAPPPWPAALPSPVHHIMTKYAGLGEWVGRLSDPLQEMCRMALFGIHEPFDPVWWGDYQKTVDMYAMYSRLSPVGRENFQDSVYWLPDAGVVKQTGSGFCYLDLFKSEYRMEMRMALQSNPIGSDLKQELLKRPETWSADFFTFSCGVTHKVGSATYQQWHVQPSANGHPVVDIVDMLSARMRVGASTDINALLNMQGQDLTVDKPTVFPERPIGGGPGVELSFNVFAQTGKDPKFPSVTFDIVREPAFTLILGVYESVQLVEASFSLQLSPGSQNSLWAAICSPTLALNTESDWYGTPVNVTLHGSDQGYVTGAFALPDMHPFEKELRAGSAVGNPYPTFRFTVNGAASAMGTVKGHFKVKCRGQYAMGHVKIGGVGAKSLVRNANNVRNSLPAVALGATVCRGVGDSDDEDEDDDESEAEAVPKGKVSSPPRANMSASR